MNEKAPLESNWLVAMLTQLLNGRFTLVAVSTAYGALGGPLVALMTTFVPDKAMLVNFGPATTSSEP